MKDPLVKTTKNLQSIEKEIKARMKLAVIEGMSEMIGSIQGHNDLTVDEISDLVVKNCYEICNAPIGNINE